MKREWTIIIEGMTCDHSATGIDRALASLDGVDEVATSFEGGVSRVIADSSLAAERMVAAIENEGYRVTKSVEGGEVAAASRAQYDLAIIGSGGAGVAAAIRAAESGKRVAIIEAGVLGGTCVNVGCVPSKTLIRAAEARHRAEHDAFDGIETHPGSVDLAALIAQKDELVSELRQGKYIDVLSAYPSVTIIEGRARFSPSGELWVDEHRVHADAVLIATGASPAVPPIEGLAETPYLTSKTVMELEELPKRLVVIGAGYIALELGQAFQRLGSRVTVLARSRLLRSDDPEIGTALTGYLLEEGMDIRLGTSVTRASHRADEGFELQLDGPEGVSTIHADQVLVAIGRRPNTSGMGLVEAGIELGRDGAIVVDDQLRTTRPSVFAAGDVIGDPAFVYVAAYAGSLAADVAVNASDRRYDVSLVPRVTFTDPAIASVGLTETAAREAGIEVSVATLPMSYVPRAIAARDTRGLIKLLADRETGLFVGAHILAPEAGDLLQQIVIAMKFGIRKDQLAQMVYPYLTGAEAIKLACQTFDKDVAKLSCCAA